MIRISKFDEQYLELVDDILTNGYCDSNRTADNTKKVFGRTLHFNLKEEFPILSVKHTGIKTLTKEMLWIYQKASNDVNWLQDRNVHIWDEWADDKNTIGKAYGYQIAKYDQINKLIHSIKDNPQSRRHVINLWNVEDLDEMQLTPCALMSIYDVNNGYLNTHLTIRSSDVALGLPYNVAQFAVLNHMLSHVTGLKPGKLMASITNAHLYEQHFEPIKEIFNRKPFPGPKLWLNPTVNKFEFFTAEDVRLKNYKYHPAIKMRVSV